MDSIIFYKNIITEKRINGIDIKEKNICCINVETIVNDSNDV